MPKSAFVEFQSRIVFADVSVQYKQQDK